MKTRNISKVIGFVCAFIILSIANILFTFGNEITNYLSGLGYKPVPDTCTYVENEGELNDNFLYKEWCEETFDNGNYIYEAYKDVAFNIKYTPELYKTDFWQTPIETERLKKGDCEDAVFLFFSHLPYDQKNVEIVWGWVINKRDTTGWAHVWYQLTDKKGQQYVVEGFSKDWNGIIPMEIVESTETRKLIFTISHSTVSRLSSSLANADSRIIQSLVDLTAVINCSNHDSGNQTISHDMDYSLLPNMSKEISNILNKLHELFYRYERQKEETNIQVACKSNK